MDGNVGELELQVVRQVCHTDFLGDGVVDDDQRDVHIDGIGPVAPVGDAIVRTGPQVGVIFVDERQEGRDSSGANAGTSDRFVQGAD